jgi:hypothetical protein
MTAENMMELADDCELYAKIIEGITVVANDWKEGDPERKEPRETLLKAAAAIRSSAVGAGARITGASDIVDEAACLIWSELCPGLIMGDADRPHYENAAKAVLALQSEPVQPLSKCTCPYGVFDPCEYCLASEPPAGKGETPTVNLTPPTEDEEEHLRSIERCAAASPVRPEAPAGVREALRSLLEHTEAIARAHHAQYSKKNRNYKFDDDVWASSDAHQFAAVKTLREWLSLPSEPVRRTTQGG